MIQSERADLTRSLHGDMLCFLQELLNKGRAFSTVYLAMISVCHVGIDNDIIYLLSFHNYFLCPVHILCCYVNRMKEYNQSFVS